MKDDFDYEAAMLFSPLDCDPFNPPRLCCGCKFETVCNTELDKPMYSDPNLPNVGDYVVFCGTACLVKGVDYSRRLLTVEVRDGEHDPYISYVYAEDVDRFDIRSNKT